MVVKRIQDRTKNRKPKGIENFADCKAIPEIADGAFLLYRPEHYFNDKKYKGFINVHPVDLRSSGRANKQFQLGFDTSRANMYELNDQKKDKQYQGMILELSNQYKRAKKAKETKK